MEPEMEMVELPDTFFTKGNIYATVETIEEAEEIIRQNPTECIGYCHRYAHPDRVHVKKVGCRTGGSEDWTACVFKVKLPSEDEIDLYEDDFADTDEAAGEVAKPPPAWKRPGRGEGLADGVQALRLFKSINANDLRQGHLGDCWLISALAALAEFPGTLRGLFTPQELSAEGHYSIRLFDPVENEWRDVDIDDRLPAASRGDKCFYAHVTDDGELWPPLIEKAVAKFCGDYHSLQGGFSVFAFAMLTGCTDTLTLFKSKSDDTLWHLRVPRFESLDHGTHFGEGSWEDGTDGAEEKTGEEIFQMLEAWDQQNFVMCAGSDGHDDTEKDGAGVVSGHAYSIIMVKSDVAGSGYNLLQLRNPWGHGEFTGDWSDKSSMWEDHPEVKEELEPDFGEDGTFWIGMEDFFERYKSIYIVRQDLGANRVKDSSNSGGDDDDIPSRMKKPIELPPCDGLAIDMCKGVCAIS